MLKIGGNRSYAVVKFLVQIFVWMKLQSSVKHSRASAMVSDSISAGDVGGSCQN